MFSGALNHSMVWIILGIIISYLIGSIPTAYIAGKILKGIDIRKAGSGNVGATNALRVLGKRAGISVLLVDILKGVLAVILIGDYILSQVSGTEKVLICDEEENKIKFYMISEDAISGKREVRITLSI